MSFQDLQNSGKRSSRQTPPPSQAVAASIFQINTAVAGFRRLVDAIGTSKDTPDLRLNLSVIISIPFQFFFLIFLVFSFKSDMN